MAIPIPYQLDILGGQQFENLIQELLLSELGLGIEAWGGSVDHGRDAYCASELNFPNRHSTNPGPFVFQAKFISGANATGAQFEQDFLGSVKKEAQLLCGRIERKVWKIPRHYGLFTNAPITASSREKATIILQRALPKTKLTIHGALDICSLLDTNISVARAFPQILSLRNLTDLLRKVVRNAAIQRSDAAIKEAEMLTHVFVPTKAYNQAWQILGKHNFVVLEGPPEMGKTAIAWMIAAVQLTQKWEAVDCDGPEDFFDEYDSSRKQVFVADDAFGVTEYETARGGNWGRQLHKILPKLNAKHWLVWTSRMHILNKAIEEMSLQGKAEQFPKPAEVIVNASRIDRNERALILYRHARAAGLEEVSKNIVRANAATLIDNSHFTPERIKRFVLEELPDLSHSLMHGEIAEYSIPERIELAIEHPTSRMEKAFAKLDTNQKWLLIALLDCERTPDLEALETAFRRFSRMQRPIEEQVHLLEEGFLQKNSELGFPAIDWIHPSYRDLVINELVKDEATATVFLEHCDIPGIRLAISVAGGAAGNRQFPLMSSPASWEILRKRLVQLIRQSTDALDIYLILRLVRTAAESDEDDVDTSTRISEILNQCCLEAKAQLDQLKKPIYSFVLEEIFDSTMALNPPPPMPSMSESLKKVESNFGETLKMSQDKGSPLEVSDVEEWAATVSIAAKTDRRLLIQNGFPAEYGTKLEQLCKIVLSEIDDGPPLDGDEAFGSEISRMRDLSRALRALKGLIPFMDRKLERTAKRAEKRAKAVERKQDETLMIPNSDEELMTDSRRTQPLDLDKLFADL